MNTSPASRRALMEPQYAFRERHPDRLAIQARYTEESRRARKLFRPRLDLAYDTMPGSRLDVFPVPGGDAPAFIFIHGGYWRSHHKDDYSFVAAPLVPRGVAAVVVGYALAPLVTIEDIVSQLRRAVLWVHTHASELGIDPDRLFVGGHSAGGHLAAMLCTTDWESLAAPRDLVKGCCAASSIFDLEPILHTSINDDLRLDPAAAAQSSPIRLVHNGMGAMILAYGTEETAEFQRQSTAFATAWRRHGLSCRTFALPGRHHYNIVLELGRGESVLTQAVIEMVSSR